MKLLTKAIEKKLIKNFYDNDGDKDFKPVVKLFGGGAATWLLSELDPDTNIAFGLCDLGFGTPELGYVSIDELKSIRFKPFNLPVERDFFEPEKTLMEYANDARNQRYIDA